MITLLVAPQEIQNETVRVEGAAYRHLFRARRAAAGEVLRVVDGQGAARYAEIQGASRGAGVLRLGEPAPSHEPTLIVRLLVATPEPPRAAWLVEKGTEIGVRAFHFITTARSARALSSSGRDRLRRVAAAAVEQAQRSQLPEVTGEHAWTELPRLLEGASPRLFLDPLAGAAPAEGKGAAHCAPTGGVAVLVGSEGGWTDEERRALLAMGCQPVGLGPRVLRIETAAVAVAGILLLPGINRASWSA